MESMRSSTYPPTTILHRFYPLRIKQMVLCVLAGCLAVAAGGPASATSYYVSLSGNDSAAGTGTGIAWQTIAKVNGRSFAAGDIVYFQGGQTFYGNLIIGSDDTGTAANPITINSYGTGKATINAGTGTGIRIFNTAGIKVSNLVVVGGWNSSSQSGNTSNGVEINTDAGANAKLDYVYVDSLEVSGFRESGIYLGGSASDGTYSGFKNVTITNCISHDNGDAGIQSGGTYKDGSVDYSHQNVFVNRCTVYNNRGIQNKGNNSGNGIVFSGVNGATIQYCTAYNNGELSNYYGGGPVGIWLWDSTNGTIQFCESYNNKSSTLDGGGFDLDGGATNCIVQYNYAHGNKGTGYLFYSFESRPCSGNTVRYNISENDSQGNHSAGVFLGGGSVVANNKVYNNTFIKNYGGGDFWGAYLDGVGTGNSFQNNIFYNGINNHQAYLNNAPGSVLQGNCYWSTGGGFQAQVGSSIYYSLGDLRAAGYEKNGAVDTGLNADPKLSNPGAGGTVGNPDQLTNLSVYKLYSNSPLINAGLNLTASPFNLNVGSRDFYADSLPQGSGYEVGAYEGTGLTPPATNTLTNGSVYQIEPQCAPGKGLDVADVSTADTANVQTYDFVGGNNQKWKAVDVGSGYWEFEPQHAIGKRLDVAGSGNTNFTNVWQYTGNSSPAQRWKLIANSDGSYDLEPQCAPGLRLDVSGSSSSNNANVQIYSTNGSSAQHWKFYVK